MLGVFFSPQLSYCSYNHLVLGLELGLGLGLGLGLEARGGAGLESRT